MLLATWCLSLAAVILAGGAAALVWRRLQPVPHPAFARRVLINFTTSHADSMQGVIVREVGEYLVLAKPVLVRETGVIEMDGDAVIDRRSILFVQVLP